MRLGVIDDRVIVDETFAIGEVEAVQSALGPFSVEQRRDVIPNDLAAE